MNNLTRAQVQGNILECSLLRNISGKLLGNATRTPGVIVLKISENRPAGCEVIELGVFLQFLRIIAVVGKKDIRDIHRVLIEHLCRRDGHCEKRNQDCECT